MAGAVELFSEHGFDQVKISDIGETAGISAGAVYRHISNKQELLDQPIREMMVIGYAVSQLVVERAATPGDALGQLIAELVRVAADRPQVVLLWHREARRVSAPVRRELATVHIRTVELWADALTAARPDITRDAAEFRVRAAWGLLNCTPLVSDTMTRSRLLAVLGRLMSTVLLAPAGYTAEIGTAGRPPANTGGLPQTRSEEILAHGARLFRAHGYHRVGIDEIGAAAGIRGPSVYNWFASKSVLLAEILERAADEFDTIVVHETVTDPRQRIVQMTRKYVAIAMANHDFIAVHTTDRQHLPADRRHRIEHRRHVRINTWVRELRRARPELPESVARVILLATFEMVMAIARSRRYGVSPEIERPLWQLAGAALMHDPAGSDE